MTEIQDLLESYIHARNKCTEYTKKMDDLKLKIKSSLKEEPTGSFSRDGLEANVKTLYKTSIPKKDCPSDIWEKYSVTTQYEQLNVKKK